MCPRRSPAAHRGALRRGDLSFVRTVTQPAPNCPAVPTGIPRTHAWPHARPRKLTSRSRPCLLWTPLRTGRGGRGAGGRAYAEHTPPWRWELRVELWPAAASQTTRSALAKEKHPMECRLEGVVMRSSALIPRVEISRHLLK